MNLKAKKILLGIAIFYISISLLFMVLAIFVSFSTSKAGSVFSLSLSVLLGVLLVKCIKTLKGSSFENKKLVKTVSISFSILAVVSIFFFTENRK